MRSTLDYNYKLELIQILQSDIDSLNYKIPVYTSNMSSAYRTDFFTGWVHVEGNIIFNTDTLQNLVRNSSE